MSNFANESASTGRATAYLRSESGALALGREKKHTTEA